MKLLRQTRVQDVLQIILCNLFLRLCPFHPFPEHVSTKNLIHMVLNILTRWKSDIVIHKEIETVIGRVYALDVLSLTPRTMSEFYVFLELEGRDKRRDCSLSFWWTGPFHSVLRSVLFNTGFFPIWLSAGADQHVATKIAESFRVLQIWNRYISAT